MTDVAADRSQFFWDFTMPFFGYNRPGAKVSEGVRAQFRRKALLGGLKSQYDCIRAFSETDQTEDLKAVRIPTLVLHGEDDQIVPIADSGALQAKLMAGARFTVIAGAPHGMPVTHAREVNQAILEFVRG